MISVAKFETSLSWVAMWMRILWGTGGSDRSGPNFYVDLRGADKDAVVRLEKFMKSMDASFDKRAVTAVQQERFRNPRLFSG